MTPEKFEWQTVEDISESQMSAYLALPYKKKHAATAAQQQVRHSEFIVALLLPCLIVAFVFLYQTDQRIALLETQLTELQNRATEKAQPSIQKETQSASYYKAEEAQDSPLALPQWQALVETLPIYQSLAELRGPRWRHQEPYIGQRYAAQTLPINLLLVPNHNSVDAFAAPYGYDGNSPSIQYQLANPLIEFILSQYGDEKIPILLDAFTKHENWETLAPAVFNITAPEFETAWHEYLRQTYPQNYNGFGEATEQ